MSSRLVLHACDVLLRRFTEIRLKWRRHGVCGGGVFYEKNRLTHQQCLGICSSSFDGGEMGQSHICSAVICLPLVSAPSGSLVASIPGTSKDLLCT